MKVFDGCENIKTKTRRGASRVGGYVVRFPFRRLGQTIPVSFTYLAVVHLVSGVKTPPIGMKTFRTAQPYVIDKGLATGCPASKTGREGDGAVVPCLSTSGNAAATTTWVSSR